MVGERDYSRFNPEEQQSELKQLFSQFPAYRLENVYDRAVVFEIQEEAVARGSRSEHKQIILRRMKDLIQLSHLTLTCQTVLLTDLNVHYDIGVRSRLSAKPNKIDEMLDLDNDMGVFSQTRAKELERDYYMENASTKESLEDLATFSVFDDQGNDISQRKREEFLQELFWSLDEKYSESFRGLVLRWHDDFVEKYGEEP